MFSERDQVGGTDQGREGGEGLIKGGREEERKGGREDSHTYSLITNIQPPVRW